MMITPAYRSDSLAFAPYPSAVPEARHRTSAVLGSWGLDELSGAAGSVVTELSENAVQATRRAGLNTPVRLTLIGGLRTVLVVVRDATAEPPVPRAGFSGDLSAWTGDDETDPDQHGKGLLIVAALAAQWDWKRCPDGGKIVRALLRGEHHDREDDPDSRRRVVHRVLRRPG